MAQDDPIDVLFTLPPEDFTAERDALAKRFKADGDADAAKTVRGLRRPTVPAWAVNQLARAAPDEVQRLLATGTALRRAQRAALSGAGGGRLRDATAQRRALLAELTERAARLLADADRNPDPHRAAIAATLEAATVEDEAADLVRSGRLSRELPPPSGFGDLSALTLVPDLHDDEEEPAAEAEPRSATDAQDAAAPAKPGGSRPARAQGGRAGRDAQDTDAGPDAQGAGEGPDGHEADEGRDAQGAEEAGADQGAQDAAALREAEQARAQEAEAEREARAAADEARARADEAEEAASAAEDEATQARERADGAVEAVRELERRLAEARREREETERVAVDAESSAYRARRAATEAAKRARAADRGA